MSNKILLEPENGTELTKYIVKLLNKKASIETLLQFLKENDAKLHNITKIPLPQIAILKVILKGKYSPPLVNCRDLYKGKSLYSRQSLISTGIKQLDELLGGGLTPGAIFEITGSSGVGKSFLCSNILLNLVKNYSLSGNCLVIDTKHDFIASRLANTLISQGELDKNGIERTLRKILVKRLYEYEELIKFLEELHSQSHQENSTISEAVKFLIIDSLPCLFFQHLGAKFHVFASMITKVTSLLRSLAGKFGITVIIINTVTKWTETKDSLNNVPERSQTIKPSLGKYWSSVPNERLLLEEIDPLLRNSSSSSDHQITKSLAAMNDTQNQNGCQRILLSLLKGNSSKTSNVKIVVQLTDNGVI